MAVEWSAVEAGGGDSGEPLRVSPSSLHRAAARGDAALVSILLRSGRYSVNSIRHGTTPLLRATRAEEVETMRVLLEAGADPDLDFPNTPLHVAALSHCISAMDLLIKHGADVHAVGELVETPLFRAVASGSEEAVMFLVKMGRADVNAPAMDMRTPLHYAAALRRGPVVQTLIECGADAHARLKNGDLPLHEACHRFSKEVLDVFLSPPVSMDINTKGENGRTPLHIAARDGYESSVRELFQRGADPNGRDDDLHTPLHQAVTGKCIGTRVLKILLGSGCEVDARSRNGSTPLHLAVSVKKGRSMYEPIKMLLCHRADPNALRDDRSTPLHLAAHFGNLDPMNLLMKNGAKVNAVNAFGRTPLHTCAEGGHHRAVESLLSNKADVHARCSQGRTPLHDASANGEVEAMTALIKGGAVVDPPDLLRWTPLHLAANGNHTEGVEVLCSLGSDVNMRSVVQRSPLEVLVRAGGDNCHTLVERGADLTEAWMCGGEGEGWWTFNLGRDLSTEDL